MIEFGSINHHIQLHILSMLIHQEFARFRDMRPKNVDTNLYSYHLKLLIKQGLVAKKTCTAAKNYHYAGNSKRLWWGFDEEKV